MGYGDGDRKTWYPTLSGWENRGASCLFHHSAIELSSVIGWRGVQIVARIKTLEKVFSIDPLTTDNGKRYAKVANGAGLEEVLVTTDKFR